MHVLILGILDVISGGVDGIKPFEHDPPCIHVRRLVFEFYTEVVFVASFNRGGAFSLGTPSSQKFAEIRGFHVFAGSEEYLRVCSFPLRLGRDDHLACLACGFLPLWF